MVENQSIKERLLLFISSQNLGKSQFENYCGFSHGWLNRIQKTLMPDKLETICLHFPSLNPSWLMTGEGTMLRVDATAESFPTVGEPHFSYGSQHINGNGNCNNTNGSGDTNVITALLSQLNVKDEQIKEQSVQIDRLLKIIEKMQ